ncbi:MAG: GTP pyrophosphokinase family protein [Oscillospiraceae bacterium]|nr:GTP pyrophosphokinase family protein [Oscillospiraceae bacterium]
MMTVYGNYEDTLRQVLGMMLKEIGGEPSSDGSDMDKRPYEHLNGRIKSDESMREKLQQRGLAETPENALRAVHDSIGIRIICSFLSDIYTNIDYIRSLPCFEVISEKDYITKAKPNGYRSYHMIVSFTAPFADADGSVPGKFFAEIQLRTLAMDSWAALEHKMKYKKDIKDQALIVSELKRCADEMASCDLSMETIRQLIEES